jgi:signal transduction histidine kinase
VPNRGTVIDRETDDHQWAEFLDRLVHDLREPLRSINVFSELLAEMSNSGSGAEGEHAITEIFGGALKMRTLLEGLAAYSLALRESSVSTTSEAAVSSLASALKIVVAGLKDQISASNATVIGLDFPPGRIPKVNVSLERLMQLFENLVGNSLRFRSEVPPVIRVSAAPDAAGMWAVHVEDNGIGVAPEDCEAIFKPFMKVEGKRYPGAGLGLSICRKIVEAHGGTIRMKPAPIRGSICTFTLPEA